MANNVLLTNGKLYSAVISLGFFEGLATNDAIQQKLIDSGFVNVTVRGSGRTREASGTWNGMTGTWPLPSQVAGVKEY